VKCPRSLKQFTLTTARAAIAVSVTAAMKTPQRRQMRKSQGGFRSDNSLPATSHQPRPRISPGDLKPCADYGCGRMSRCTPAVHDLPAVSKAEDAREYWRSDTRPDGPFGRVVVIGSAGVKRAPKPPKPGILV
jgi:hypothetical protein